MLAKFETQTINQKDPQTILPPVSTLCRTTVFIWHVLATSTSSVTSPAVTTRHHC